MERVNNFKVGDYVVYEKGNTTNDSVYKIIDYWDGAKYYEGVCVSQLPYADKTIEDIDDMNYRQASVLDYIRTLSVEQIAELIIRMPQCFSCKHITECWAKPIPRRECKTYRKEGLIEFFVQPLTDEIIKQLGGVKNDRRKQENSTTQTH